jgi:hypothetical protein
MSDRASGIATLALAAVMIGGGSYLGLKYCLGDFSEPPERAEAHRSVGSTAPGSGVAIAPNTSTAASQRAAAQTLERLRRGNDRIVAVPRPERQLPQIRTLPFGQSGEQESASEPQASAETLPEAARQPAKYRIDREGIRGAVRASLPEIRECYESWLQANPDIGGRIAVKLTVTTSDKEPNTGLVSAVSLGDERIGHAPMEGCILSVFQELRFEAPEGGKLDITYPIELRSDGDR